MLPAIILFALTYVLFILTGMLPGSQIIGASANIAGIGILRKEGYEVANSDFSRSVFPSPWLPSFPPVLCTRFCSVCNSNNPTSAAPQGAALA